MTEAVFPTPGPNGLHARTAGLLMKAASAFKARIDVSANGRTADAKSVMGLLALGAEAGTPLTIRADGPEAEQAVKAIGAFLTGQPIK